VLERGSTYKGRAGILIHIGALAVARFCILSRAGFCGISQCDGLGSVGVFLAVVPQRANRYGLYLGKSGTFSSPLCAGFERV
jgi:hypothetical protein